VTVAGRGCVFLSGAEGWTVGIDPGHSGGLAIVDPGGDLVFVRGWRKIGKRGYEAFEGVRGDALAPFSVPTLWAAMRTQHGPPGARYHVEKIRLEKRGGSIPRGIITLAENAGIAVGFAESRAWAAGERPGASTWRRDVLGIGGRTKAAAAEAAAVAAVLGVPRRGSRRVVDLGIGWPPDLITGHVAEAVCIALWGRGWRV